MSLDKREAMTKRGEGRYFQKKGSREENSSVEKEEKDSLGRKMTEIPFGQPFSIKSQNKGSDIDYMKPRNMTAVDKKQRSFVRISDDMNEQKEMSSMGSQISKNSEKLAAIFDKNRSYRKKIFY